MKRSLATQLTVSELALKLTKSN